MRSEKDTCWDTESFSITIKGGGRLVQRNNTLYLLLFYSMSCIRIVAHIVNCGYARVSIYENSSPLAKGQYARDIDRQKRSFNFRSQFVCSSYGIPDGYFEQRGKDGNSQFDRDCNKILDGFFQSDMGLCRDKYLNTFSIKSWSELCTVENNRHTLSHCTRCFECHEQVKKFTANVLSELNRVYRDEASTSFTDSLLKTKSVGLERKKSKIEKKKEMRDMHRQVTKKINECFAEEAAITLLTEGESKQKYQRKRIAQSFCSPDNQPQRKKKKHIHQILKMSHGIHSN